MSKREFKTRAACTACKSTGVYVGMAERDGSAVVCHVCRGSGERQIKIEYEDFEGRKKRNKVTQVFETNPGICIGNGNGLRVEDFGGISYQSFLDGGSFGRGTEMRRFTCPAWWFQCADYVRKPEWRECLNNIGGAFAECNEFSCKEKCWKRWDKENP